MRSFCEKRKNASNPCTKVANYYNFHGNDKKNQAFNIKLTFKTNDYSDYCLSDKKNST